MKFSIITTIHAWHEDKIRQLNRCLKSVSIQSFDDYEHIVVDDGSTFEINDIVNSFDKTRLIQTVHNERVVALNMG
jgi:glycosyltransferase involved in cell wall biosynthesis